MPERVRCAAGVAILSAEDQSGRVRIIDESRGVLEMGLPPSLGKAVRALAEARMGAPVRTDALPASCDVECAMLVHELLAQGVLEPCGKGCPDGHRS